MAVNKIISANGSKGHHKFTLEVVESSTSGNSSFLSFTFKISAVQTSWNWYGWGDKIKYTVTINGTNYTGTIPDYDGSSTVTLKKGSNIEVEHESDGTKTINISFSVVDNANQRYTCGNASASSTFTLSVLHTPPSITNVSILERDSRLTALSLDNSTIVSFLSQKRFTITATPYDGATITTYKVYYGSTEIGTSSTNVVDCNFANISLADGVITINAIDNQGGVGVINITYPLIQYTKPTLELTSTTIKRKTDANTGLADDQTVLNLIGGYYYDANNVVGRNTTISSIEYKIWNELDPEPSYTNVVTQATISNGSVTIPKSNEELIIYNIDFQKVYRYKIIMTDNFGNQTELKEGTVPTGVAVWTEYKDRVDFLKLTINNAPILMPYSLYDNSSGANGDITLSDSAANYQFLEIFYRDDINQYTSTKIYNPNGKRITLFMSVINPNNSQTFVQSACKDISGTSITHQKASEVRIDSHSANTSNYIYITKVIGYK